MEQLMYKSFRYTTAEKAYATWIYLASKVETNYDNFQKILFLADTNHILVYGRPTYGEDWARSWLQNKIIIRGIKVFMPFAYSEETCYFRKPIEEINDIVQINAESGHEKIKILESIENYLSITDKESVDQALDIFNANKADEIINNLFPNIGIMDWETFLVNNSKDDKVNNYCYPEDH